MQLDIAYVNIKAKKDGSNFHMETYLYGAQVYVTPGSWYEKNVTETVLLGMAFAVFVGIVIKCMFCSDKKNESSAHRLGYQPVRSSEPGMHRRNY